MSEFGLMLEAIHERLDRIEDALGITDPTPSQQQVERLADERWVANGLAVTPTDLLGEPVDAEVWTTPNEDDS